MEYFERHTGGERAIIVHLDIRQIQDPDDLGEFELLADSAGADRLALVTGSRARPDARYFVGSGKAEEIAELVREHDADIVLFNHSLSPSQERNIEALVQCRVLDRTGLILDIFAQRARTYEGKLQVELAQLNHLSTRLVRGWTHLERQKGGIGLRGPGETQLETDRRLLQVRVMQLKSRIEKVRQTRAQGRARRQKSDVPTISLVGYTNAGKSTLFNRLVDENIYAADKLFATLDPTLRRLDWQGVGRVVLVDTVGFVRHLPHELVESFHATLEETLEADLLLHVIDSSSEDMHEQIQAVKDVLAEIDNDVPVLNVYNKIDLTDEPARIGYASEGQPNRVYVSSRENLGMEELSLAVQQLLTGTLTTFDLTLPYNAGQLKNALYELGVIQEESYDDSGHECLTIRLPSDRLRQLLGQANLEPLDVLPLAQATLLMPILEEFEKPDEDEEQTMTDAEEKAFAEFEALNAEAERAAQDLITEDIQTPDSQK
ncbi:probable GTP - binding protein, possible phage lambda cII repressor [Psychrobacter arcticus 273-4]|uniref:GTPase HflX n=1 Tax=Psychrobacter arcticus (strain DSM 17307 / VKM B-2377 / 273-4) TaxID=259536 RepID=Q4FUT4_PSYA2|nr:ribosome rescue GTPase HflX [Psychrobacter arcticus]AAZ18224.1 probable GTP - binding protein, possible phage lambda cII repressor [Psychrobacter arcticus 273-4]